MELESQGYFATRALSSDPRWRNGSIYLFGLDTYGYALFSGDPYSQWYGLITPELNDHLDGPFDGRGCGKRRRRVRGNLPVLLDAQSRHWNAAAQGDFRQEGRGLWPADPGRLRLLSGRGSVRPGEGWTLLRSAGA